MRRSGAVNSVRESDREGQLPASSMTASLGCAGVRAPSLRKSSALLVTMIQSSAIARARISASEAPRSPSLVDVHRVETMRRAEMAGEQRRQVLVDQEVLRHNLPPGRPRGGFALA